MIWSLAFQVKCRFVKKERCIVCIIILFQSRCSENPCLSILGTMCIPHYGNRSFECKCKSEYAPYNGKCKGKIPKDGLVEQTSILQVQEAELSVDGNYNQDIDSCSITRNESESWWKFTFQFNVSIVAVGVYGRVDRTTTRLNYATIEVIDEDETHFHLCGDVGKMSHEPKKSILQQPPDWQRSSNHFCSTHLIGRRVQITQIVSGYMSVCEINFYGDKLTN